MHIFFTFLVIFLLTLNTDMLNYEHRQAQQLVLESKHFAYFLTQSAVRAVRADPNNYDNLWGLFRLGHLAFRQGLGLPVEAVEDSIKKGMRDENA